MSITITSGGFDGIIRSDTDGNIFIETENKSKSLTINGLIAYTGSTIQDLNPATGKVTKERKFSHDTGRELIRSASATANQIEFQQTTAGAFMHLSGSDNTMGINFMGGGTRTRTFRQVVDTFIRGTGVFSIGYNFKDTSGNFEYNITPTVSIATRTAATLFTISSSGDAFVKNNLNVGGTITSQEFHTEVTSASIMLTSGSTVFGNSVDDTHTFTGHITASGDISASGNIYGTNITASGISLVGGGSASFGEVLIDDYIVHNGDPDTYIGFPTGDKFSVHCGGINFMRAWQKDSDVDKFYFNYNEEPMDFIFRTANNNPGLYISGSGNVGIGGAGAGSGKALTVAGDISASGVIKGDGGISGSNGTFTGTITAEHLSSTDDAEITDDLTVGGDIIVADNIIHNGDTDTKIAFTTDAITMTAGNVEMLKLYEGVADALTINEAGADMNVRVETSGNANMLFVDGGEDRVGIGTSTPQAELHIEGAVTSSGGFIGGGTFATGSYDFPGAIMGYNVQGVNVANAEYTLTTSYAVPDADMNVTFVAPRSGIVEIEVQVYHDVGSGGAGDLFVGLSDAASYSAVQDYYEQGVLGLPRFDHSVVTHKWVVSGLTTGVTYKYWFGTKVSNTSGTPKLHWGGNAANKYPDFVMKATALPSNTTIET